MAREKIQDQRTGLPIMKQGPWLLHKRKARLCVVCGEKAVPGATGCLKHLVVAQDRGQDGKAEHQNYRLKAAAKAHDPHAEGESLIVADSARERRRITKKLQASASHCERCVRCGAPVPKGKFHCKAHLAEIAAEDARRKERRF